MIFVWSLAVILISVGLLGLLVSFVLVYKRLNRAQLSLNPLTGRTREHHQGLSLKWPWSILQDPEIDMTAEIVVTSGGVMVMTWEQFIAQRAYEKIGKKAYETKDSVLYGNWATAMRPAKGMLERFVQKTPQTGALMVMAEIDIGLSDHLAKQMTDDVLADKRAISDLVANVFGPSDERADSDVEKSYGVIVSRPKLFDLDLGERSREASEKLFEAKKFRTAVEEMKKVIEDEEKAANAVLIATGMAKKTVFEIQGLEGALRSVAGAAEAFFRRKS